MPDPAAHYDPVFAQPGERQLRRPSLRGEVSVPRLAVERALQMLRLYQNWPTALADRLGLIRRKGHVLYRLRPSQGRAEFIARSNGFDVRAISEIWIGRLYDRFVDPSSVPGDSALVVDIGANCGYFAVYAAIRYPNARIVCFEPHQDNLEMARINLALNGVSAELRPEAVVPDASPSVTLHLSTDPRLHTTVSPEGAGRHGIHLARYSGRTVEVPAVNLNDALRPIAAEQAIDLLKIDVEGLDVDLLECLDDDVLTRINYIVAEPEHRDTTDVVKRLTACGFHVLQEALLLFASRAELTTGA